MQNWQKVNELFHAALEREPEERSAFLQEACAGDAALLKEVSQLISAHESAGGFIQGSAVTDADKLLLAADEPVNIGRRFGPWRVIRDLGRGGMGAVFLAERADAQYEQRVAIKLIKRGMDSDAVLRQFHSERQILASLDHPNIARLLDGGTTDDGLPYFVMEYIDGLPIDEYCEEHRLPVTARLELFRQVCTAVSYAHQRLIVHRDLKPSNIFVTAEGLPKLLDFGIAKILHGDISEGSLRTQTGLLLMTPEYASPEQAQGLRANTLSDIYSLGVVLYELLTDHLPYRFKLHSLQEISQTISTVEPEKPSEVVMRAESLSAEDGDQERITPEKISATREGSPQKLRRRLRGDLDNVVLMALRKEPQRRYLSVEQFSDDIRRHLAGLPVLARPNTLVYRGRKFVRRNRVAVAAAALVLVSLIGGIVATTWQARRAKIQETVARAAQARAERRFQDVRKLARTVLFDYHDEIKNLPGATPVRARLVRDALEYLDSLAGEAGTDASLQRELASAYNRVADVQGGTMYANLGDTAGAIRSYRKSLKILETLAAANPQDSETRRALASSYSKLGDLLWETGDMAGGLENNRKSVSAFQELVRNDPSNFDLLRSLMRSQDRVGMILQESGDLDSALEYYRQGLEILEAFPLKERESEVTRRSFSVTYEHIGSTLLMKGDLKNALAHNGKALAIRSDLSSDFPLNADYRRTLAVSHYNQGEILANMGHTREALQSYRRNLAIAEELSAADPQNEQYRGDVAYALIRVGDMLSKLGDHAQALPSYRRSLRIRAKDVKADPANLWKRSSLIEAHAKICRTLAKAVHKQEAVGACAETSSLMASTALEPTNAAFRGFFAETYSDLGEAYSTLALEPDTPRNESRKSWESARTMYGKSLEIWQDMQKRGILSGLEKDRPDKVAAQIVKCDVALQRSR